MNESREISIPRKMAALNWISLEGTCPKCRSVATIRCQTHVAADYGGDATGRFHGRTYHLSERMAWWPETGAALGSRLAAGLPPMNPSSAKRALRTLTFVVALVLPPHPGLNARWASVPVADATGYLLSSLRDTESR